MSFVGGISIQQRYVFICKTANRRPLFSAAARQKTEETCCSLLRFHISHRIYTYGLTGMTPGAQYIRQKLKIRSSASIGRHHTRKSAAGRRGCCAAITFTNYLQNKLFKKASMNMLRRHARRNLCGRPPFTSAKVVNEKRFRNSAMWGNSHSAAP